MHGSGTKAYRTGIVRRRWTTLQCPDRKVQLFDTKLDQIQFGWNSLKLEDWIQHAQWLQFVGLLSVDMALLWRPTDVFGLKRTKELEVLFEEGDGTMT